jgi:hypothetical protein
MALPAIQNVFSTIAYQSVAKVPWLHIASTVARLVVLLGYLDLAVKRVCAALHGKVSWGERNSLMYRVRGYLFGYTNIEILLNLKFCKPEFESASDKEFSLQGARYQAFSSSKRRAEVTKEPQFFVPEPGFADVMEKSSATIFVNLIPNGLRNVDFVGFPSASERIHNISLWSRLSVDKQGPLTVNILDTALLAAQTLQRNESVCIHYERKEDEDGGDLDEESIATFMGIVEFIRRKDQFKGFSDVALRLAMVSILEEIAKTAPGRSPSRAYLDILLEPAFLRRLAN